MSTSKEMRSADSLVYDICLDDNNPSAHRENIRTIRVIQADALEWCIAVLDGFPKNYNFGTAQTLIKNKHDELTKGVK